MTQLGGIWLEIAQVDTHAMSMRRKREMIGKLDKTGTKGLVDWGMNDLRNVDGFILVASA